MDTAENTLDVMVKTESTKYANLLALLFYLQVLNAIA